MAGHFQARMKKVEEEKETLAKKVGRDKEEEGEKFGGFFSAFIFSSSSASFLASVGCWSGD